MTDGSISRIWCGHYPYLKNYLSLSYIQTMKKNVPPVGDGEQNGARPYNNFAIPQPLQLVAYLTVFARLFMMSETLSLKGKY